MKMMITFTEEDMKKILLSHVNMFGEKMRIVESYSMYGCSMEVTDEPLPPPVVEEPEPAIAHIFGCHKTGCRGECVIGDLVIYETVRPAPVFYPPPSYSGDSQGSVFDIPPVVKKKEENFDDDIPF